MDQNFIGVTIEDYKFIRVIGEGVSSTVYQALDEKNNILVAIKVLPKEQVFSHPKYEKLMRTEIEVLKLCANENVLEYFKSFETLKHVFIVTEFCNGGDLDEFLITKRKLSEEDAVFFLKQIINGFKGLHEVKAMHRDFKAANILLHNEKTCKIADLGFAKILEKDQTSQTVIGTALTMAPEVLQCKPYGFKADIWSLGVVFYQMLFGKYPYRGKTNSEILYSIKNRPFNFNASTVISDDAKDFIYRCLTVDPVRRISWKKIYSHPLICEKKTISEIKLKSMSSLTGNKEFYNCHSLSGEFEVEKMSICNSELLNKRVNKIPELKIQNFVIEPQTAPSTPIETIDENEELKIREEFSNIIYPHEHINPLIQDCKDLRLNHAVCMFLISKYEYVELLEFDKKTKSNNHRSKPGMEAFNKTVEKTIKDVRLTKEGYRINVRMSTLEIQNELTNSEKINEMEAFRKLLCETICSYKENLCCLNNFMSPETENSVNLLTHSLENYISYLNKSKREITNDSGKHGEIGDLVGFV